MEKFDLDFKVFLRNIKKLHSISIIIMILHITNWIPEKNEFGICSVQ